MVTQVQKDTISTRKRRNPKHQGQDKAKRPGQAAERASQGQGDTIRTRKRRNPKHQGQDKAKRPGQPRQNGTCPSPGDDLSPKCSIFVHQSMGA